MKRFVLIIFLSACGISMHAQNATLNNLKLRLNIISNDSVKVSILDSLSMYYLFFYNNADSTFFYCKQYLNKAFEMPDKKNLILAYARLSFYYTNVNENKEALNAALQGLSLSEQYNIKSFLSMLYYDLSFAYTGLNDENEGLKMAFMGVAYLNQSQDPFFDVALHLYGDIGNCYQDFNKPDSAIFYFKKMDSVVPVSKESAAKEIADYYWAEYYLYYKSQYKQADSVITKGINECLANGDFLLVDFHRFSSDSYYYQKEIHKAMDEAKIILQLSVESNYRYAQNSAASMLNICYEKLGKLDSAYYYLKMKDSVAAVIQNHSNALDIQQSRFDQQISNKEKEAANIIQEQKNRSKIIAYVFATAFAFFIVILAIQWRNSKHRRKANEILQQQKEKVEIALSDLKSTQVQLIQSEKMASLGELTAGIAHEIQNPLNFVNNFSEINKELSSELIEEVDKGNTDEIKAIANDIKDNSEKINHHGKRADAIVKGMLQHSRSGTGVKEPADINKLADEYLRLAYHGIKAKDNSFNATMKINFDESIGKINIVPQDIGRVLLNLYNNAFYALNEKRKSANTDYQPEVEVETSKDKNGISISVCDNGNGIPQKIIDKIFQPFFTTKPTGQGTGLGLSLSYDIIKAHGGDIKVHSKEGEGTEFVILFSENIFINK
jgi:signal transduction histidine kinase